MTQTLENISTPALPTLWDTDLLARTPGETLKMFNQQIGWGIVQSEQMSTSALGVEVGVPGAPAVPGGIHSGSETVGFWWWGL